MTVAELRKQGYKIQVHHWRYDTWDKGAMYPSCMYRETHEHPVEKGGLTEITVTTPTGETGFGVAECSRKDRFNRKIGVAIALGRAMKNLANDSLV